MDGYQARLQGLGLRPIHIYPGPKNTANGEKDGALLTNFSPERLQATFKIDEALMPAARRFPPP